MFRGPLESGAPPSWDDDDDDDDDEHEEEEEYDEDVLWALRLAMASKKLRATDTHDTQMMMMLTPR